MGWQVDKTKKHFYYDENGDGVIDTVFGIHTDGRSLVSQSVHSGGRTVRHRKNQTGMANWETDMQALANKGVDGRAPMEAPVEGVGPGVKVSAVRKYERTKKEQEGLEGGGQIYQIGQGEGDYGAQAITKEDFFDPSGGQRPFSYVIDLLADKLGIPTEGSTSRMGNLASRVQDFMPKLDPIDKEKLGFLREEYGAVDDPSTPDVDEAEEGGFAESIAGEEAGLGLEKGLYGLQAGAEKLGGAMRSTAGGMAGGLRAGMAGQEKLKTKFGEAQDKYGLAKREAALAVDKGVYGLQKEQFDEQEFKTFVESLSDI